MRQKNKAFWVLSLIFGFYCLDFFFRIAQSIVVKPLLHQYHTTPLGLGGFASAFYVAYLIMQLPAGVLLDKYRFTRLYALAIVVCVLAFIAFVFADQYWVGYGLRLLVGAASALSFIGILYLARCYFAPVYFSMITGLAIGVGTLAASLVQIIGSWLMTHMSWQWALTSMALCGLGFGLVLLLPSLQLPPVPQRYQTTWSWTKFYRLITTPRVLLNAIVGGLFYLPTTIFAIAWGVAFLQQDYHLTRTVASWGTFCLFLGWAVGSPFMGMIATKRSRYDYLIGGGALAATIFSLLMIYTRWFGAGVLALLFLMGLASSTQTIIWKVFYDDTPDDMTGIGAAVTNMIIMLSGALFHVLVGYLLSLGWLNNSQGQLSYRVGLSIIPLSFIVVMILSWVTYRR